MLVFRLARGIVSRRETILALRPGELLEHLAVVLAEARRARAHGQALPVDQREAARMAQRALRPVGDVLPESARASLVGALRAVDYVLLFSEPNVEALLQDLRPDVHAKGTDYTTETVPERATSAPVFPSG